ncbi:MAG TPA: hypothetical protein VGD84_07050, partial [Pseudonocardiaceae bacterium]
MLKQIGRRATLFAAVCAATALTLGATAGANAASPQTSPSAHKAAIVAAHMHKFVTSQRGHTAARPHVAAGPLLYGGGPVQHNPKVFLVFWGSQWNSDGNGVQSYLTNYFSGLGTSSDHWSTVTSQYTDNSGSGP